MGWGERANPNSEYNRNRNKGGCMGDKEKQALKRLGRGIVGLTISGIISFFTQDPKFIALAPVINAIGKWLRARFRIPNIPF